MSALTIMDLAKVTEVYYIRGVFKGDVSQQKYLRAPFVLVTLPSVAGETEQKNQYFMPESIGDVVNDTGLLADDTLTDEVELGRHGHFGYLTNDRIFVEEHEMGALTDNWKGVHSIGLM